MDNKCAYIVQGRQVLAIKGDKFQYKLGTRKTDSCSQYVFRGTSAGNDSGLVDKWGTRCFITVL